MSAQDSPSAKKQKQEPLPQISPREAMRNLYFNECEDLDNIRLDKTLTLERYTDNHFKYSQRVSKLMLHYGDDECNSALFVSIGKFKFDVDEAELRNYVWSITGRNRYLIQSLQVRGSMGISADDLLDSRWLTCTKVDTTRMLDGRFCLSISYKIEKE